MNINEDYRTGPDGLLTFNGDIVHTEPKLFYLNGCRDLFLTLPPEEETANRLLYALYEKNAREEDISIFNGYDINYNLKVVLPGLVGDEYIKSIPHFHPVDNTTGETFTEIHEIIQGEGIILLQKNEETRDLVNKVSAVEFKPGDQLFIRSGNGHTTINTGREPVIIGSLIKRSSETNFEPFMERRGCIYYLIRTEDGRSEFVFNPHYPKSVGLDILPAPALDNPHRTEGSIYQAFVQDPERFSVLWK